MTSVNLTGIKVGEWEVIHKLEKLIGKNSYWVCRCSCGIVKNIREYDLKVGRSTSCGHRGINKYEIVYDPNGAYVLVELNLCKFTEVDIDTWFNLLIDYKWCTHFDKKSKSFYVSTSVENKIRY